jgi:predicted dithiol-disulfide oxidoreductase (DUF899 family)
MNIDELAYLIQFDYYRSNCGYKVTDWLKARELLRKKDKELLRKKEAIANRNK